ncbi:MAG: hypothetical protein JST62_00155 [Bacteroidetes bacterium]|nr:hypothetical protein [Bacteroidota bacterium]
MERILMTQNEYNNGTDYIVVDGKLIENKDSIMQYNKEFSDILKWKKLASDNDIEIRKNRNRILFKSFYNENDVVGRSIYYMYLIDKDSDYNTLIDFLENDSKVINRTIDRMAVDRMIETLKKNQNLKRLLNLSILLIVIGIAMFLIFKK